MKRKVIFSTILPIVALLLFSYGCAGSSSSICPPLGTVSSIEGQGSPLKVDTLVNSNMPDFNWDEVECQSCQSLNTSARLGQYSGKPIMIVFHKTMNCPGCKQQLPFIQATYEKWKDKGLVVLTVYRGDRVEEVKGYVQKNNINFMALADPEDKVASKLGFAVAAPITVFIDKSGVIKKYQIGPLKSQEEIETILNSL